MRVLHIGKYYPPHQGGMETHLQVLCEELRRSVNVEVMVANDDRRTTEELIGGVNVTRVGTVFNLAAAPICPEMVRRIRDANTDLVHIHIPNPAAILMYLASGHRGRLVFTYHSDIVRQQVLGKAFRPFLRHALNRADSIIVSSPTYINTSPVLPEYRDRCRVIPFGISLKQFERANMTEISRIRQQYGPRIVLGVGRLVYYKGFEHLIKAMTRIQGRLLIVGNGPLRNELEQKAKAYGVGEHVTFLTNVKDVRPYYHAADVFALASVARNEAFGIVQLEAMACSKPVVNTDLDSGVTFVSLDGVTGLTVPPANPEVLGKVINSLLDDPRRCAEYGRAGRRRVEEEFSLEVMAGRTLQLYSEIMNSKGK